MTFTGQSTSLGTPLSATALLRGGPLVAGVEVSAVISEAHSMKAAATRVALESGAKVTDHVILEPTEVTVTFALNNAGAGTGAARSAFESFSQMLLSRTPLELITEHAVYRNMVITALSPTHQAPFKGALGVSLTLQQIHFVQLESSGRAPNKLGSKKSTGGSGKAGSGKARSGKAGSGKGTTRKTASRPVNRGTVKAKKI